MGTIVVPAPVNDFKSACSEFELYPSNLVSQPTFLSSLQAYETRLKDPGEDKALFAPEENAYIAFRDLNSDNQSTLTKFKLHCYNY